MYMYIRLQALGGFGENKMIGAVIQTMTPIISQVGPGNFFWGGSFGFFGLAWIAMFILGLLLCVWIYRDANSRGMNGILWVLAVLVGSLFWLGWLVVLVIYLLVRGSARGHPLI